MSRRARSLMLQPTKREYLDLIEQVGTVLASKVAAHDTNIPAETRATLLARAYHLVVAMLTKAGRWGRAKR